MKIALLSDIHSNKYALLKAMEELDKHQPDLCIVLGDMFGYYPWAKDTYQIIRSFPWQTKFILGNHDYLVRETFFLPHPLPEYYPVILQNRNELPKEAIEWMKAMDAHMQLTIEGYTLNMFHGSPDDQLYGRFYPDNTEEYNWFPKAKEIVIMGHTHYPLVMRTAYGGYIINPGSVGQPRKKSSKSTFAILDLPSEKVELIEFSFDVLPIIQELEQLNWYTRAIDSLRKISIE